MENRNEPLQSTFKTSDGLVFTDEAQAKKHQNKLDKPMGFLEWQKEYRPNDSTTTYVAMLAEQYANYIKSFQPAEVIPYQKCPKCDGQGTVSKPRYVAGDVHSWTSTSTVHTCDVCNGSKVIPMLTHATHATLARAIDSSVEDKWISVNEVDKLPYKKGLVLFLVERVSVYIGILHHNKFQIWGLGRPEPLTDMNVTHWQPLPFVPQFQQDDNQGATDERSVATMPDQGKPS